MNITNEAELGGSIGPGDALWSGTAVGTFSITQLAVVAALLAIIIAITYVKERR